MRDCDDTGDLKLTNILLTSAGRVHLTGTNKNLSSFLLNEVSHAKTSKNIKTILQKYFMKQFQHQTPIIQENCLIKCKKGMKMFIEDITRISNPCWALSMRRENLIEREVEIGVKSNV